MKKPSCEFLSAPVVAEGKVFVALTDAHRIMALDEKDGKVIWTFIAGGRLDTPPTIEKGCCLFGCHDGYVYCVSAADGRLVWRFRAAPMERRIVAYGQVESSWPVMGGVLVVNGLAYASSGWSTEADGGLFVHALDVKTGQPVWTGRRVTAGLTRQIQSRMYVGDGDMLVYDGQTLALGGRSQGRFDAKTGEEVKGGKFGGIGVSIVPSRFGKTMGCVGGPLAFSDKTVYSTGRKVLEDRKTRAPTVVARLRTARNTDPPVWEIPHDAAQRVDALVLCGDKILAAVVGNKSANPAGELWLMSAKDGSRTGAVKLKSAPVFEGLAVAGGKVVICCLDGTVICLGKKI